MKISPVAHGSGTPGQALGNAQVSQPHSADRMERAKALAAGHQPPELNSDPQSNRLQQDVRKIKMNTQRSTNREEPSPEALEASPDALSSTPEVTEEAAAEDTKPLSPQFAALAKQKRALQIEKAEFEKVKAQQQGGNSQELIARLQKDPLSVLQEHGVLDGPEFYNSVTEKILSGEAINPEIQALRDEIKALKKGVDDSFSTREQQAEESALTEMLYEAENLAKEGDAFEMIRERDAYDQVLRLIHSTYKKSGRVLDVSEAMNTVEGQLLAEAEKLASISKVRNKFAPPAPQLQPQQKTGMRTLTAKDSATATMSARARAIAAFQGTLRK